MGIFEDARVVVLLADHIATDASNKINALGVGFAIVGVLPTGVTPAMSVGVLVDIPSKYVGSQFALSVELRDTSVNEVVKFPTPTGAVEALRIQQLVMAERGQMPGVFLPPDMPARIQVVVGFVNGLPLTPGHFYEWKAEVEGQSRRGWSAAFHVAGPPPGPVVGGPASPTPTDLPPLGVDEG